MAILRDIVEIVDPLAQALVVRSSVENCWFASDVTAATLVVKNKSISPRWEMNSILMQI